MTDQETDKTVGVKPKYSKKKMARNAILFSLAVTVAFLHYQYVGIIYENITHFSHLSDLEKEIAFRSEMGFYYSYYKTIIEEPMFIDGIFKVMYDRLVEYPDYVNAFNRFNIHPEVMIGAVYRYLEPVLNTTANRDCGLVYRGPEAPPAQACAGKGHPATFYLHAVWALHAVLPAAVLLHATTLSESLLGGLLSVAQYLANHSEATRAQWHPNLRENLAAPLLFLQMWLLSLQLSYRSTCFRLQVSVFIINCLCLLSWQFSQFIFLTQIIIFFIMEQLRIIDLKTFCVFLHSHFCGLHLAVLLLQGNDMLKTSLYASTFIVISIYAIFLSSFRIKIVTRLDFFVESWLVFLRIFIVGFTSVYLKRLISDFLNVADDDHIWQLLLAKFTNYKSFHTLIYTNEEVFDFLPLHTILSITLTLLLPFALSATILVPIYWIRSAIKEVEKMKDEAEVEETKSEGPDLEKDDTDDSGIENNSETSLVKKKERLDLDKLDKDAKCDEKEVIILKDSFIAFIKVLNVDAAIFYNIAQMVVFGVLAVLFMRLKLLFVTQMCIVCPLILNSKYEIKVPALPVKHVVWTMSTLILMYEIFVNVSQELSVISAQVEFDAFRTEELMQWIMKETSTSAVFAGTMPILATVMLTTRRPVVLHPHYENARNRDRVYAVYKAYGRFTPEELYQELTKLQATYLILQMGLCYSQQFKSGQDDSLLSLWDQTLPSRTQYPVLCHTLLTEHTEHLYPVYRNQWYTVFRVHDLSVRYMPRVFDT